MPLIYSDCTNAINSSVINNFIKLNTTVEEFDRKRAAIPGYKLNHGGRLGFTALMAAVVQGNIPLIKHIVQVGGKGQLELKNYSEQTALICAIKEKKYEVVKTLIELGVDVNEVDDNPLVTTQNPLQTATERARDVALVRLLLKNGAKTERKELNDNGVKILNQAEKEIRTFNEMIGQAIPLPRELLGIIKEYLEEEKMKNPSES